jgi:hypothetical protein
VTTLPLVLVVVHVAFGAGFIAGTLRWAGRL